MKIKKILKISLIFFFLYTIFFYRAISINNKNPLGEKEFVIEKGQGVEQIAQNLKNEGFLMEPFWFKVYVASVGKKNNFYSGEYLLRTDWNIKTLVEKMTNNAFIGRKEITLTFLEGWTIVDYDNYLTQNNFIRQGEFLSFSKEYKNSTHEFLFDKPSGADLEGFLYPDTYRVYENSKIEDIVEKMITNFEFKLDKELREEIKKQGKSIFEVITLASIVEKEMFGYENRQKVADVFLKRLKIGMPLQSDATINFITQKGVVAPSYADLQVKSAYNTYQNKGLPPGPICNPSVEAIKAVIYPIKTDYWYFLTTPDNKIIFSKNHDEHVLNKYKYLK